ncbi:MAG: glycosyltransferase family 2 protein [Burkholderiales bacterium]|nr:glycosyltransferase family 2 protein [Burkholderiales bacterium]
MRIAALLTCHNRRRKTLACLDALAANAPPRDAALEIFLTDDGSTDGTAAAVAAAYPRVHLVPGDGTLYWNGGMRKAFGAALRLDFDAYLWLNDDTILYPTALSRLIGTWRELAAAHGHEVVVVGSTQDVVTGELTYGGVVRRSRWRPMAFTMVRPAAVARECESMWGNCVLVPRAIARAVGNLDPSFTHSMGDVDYGLRVRKAGYRIWVMPGYAGTCSTNPPLGTYEDPRLPVRQRLAKMMQPKGMPLRAWRILTHRHAGPLWFLYWLWPYLKVVAGSFVRR